MNLDNIENLLVELKETNDLNKLKEVESQIGNTSILGEIANNKSSDLELLQRIFNKTKKKFVLENILNNPNSSLELKNNIELFLFGEIRTLEIKKDKVKEIENIIVEKELEQSVSTNKKKK